MTVVVGVFTGVAAGLLTAAVKVKREACHRISCRYSNAKQLIADAGNTTSCVGSK